MHYGKTVFFVCGKVAPGSNLSKQVSKPINKTLTTVAWAEWCVRVQIPSNDAVEVVSSSAKRSPELEGDFFDIKQEYLIIQIF